MKSKKAVTKVVGEMKSVGVTQHVEKKKKHKWFQKKKKIPAPQNKPAAPLSDPAMESQKMKQKRKGGNEGSWTRKGVAEDEWTDITPDPNEILIGSTEGGFFGLEEIDASAFMMESGHRNSLLDASDDGDPGAPREEEGEEKGKDSQKKKKKKNKTTKEKAQEKIDVKIGTATAMEGGLLDGEPDADQSSGDRVQGLLPSMGPKAKGKKKSEATEKEMEKKKRKKNKKKSSGCAEGDAAHVNNDGKSEDRIGMNGTTAKTGKLVREGEHEQGSPSSKKRKQRGAEGILKDKVAEKGKLEKGKNRLSVDVSVWQQYQLDPTILRALSTLGFEQPTPIQQRCIPAALLQGKDVIGAAETGSGKTLAFGIPIIQRLIQQDGKQKRKSANTGELQQDDDSDDAKEEAEDEGTLLEGDAASEGRTSVGNSCNGSLKALILTPTRELALQVGDHIRSVARYTSIRVVTIVGGMAPQKQQRLLSKRPAVVVATPGRLWELISLGEPHLVQLDRLAFFVLDEADRMVEKGHFQELQSIIDLLPKNQKAHMGKPKGKYQKRKGKEVKTSDHPKGAMAAEKSSSDGKGLDEKMERDEYDDDAEKDGKTSGQDDEDDEVVNSGTDEDDNEDGDEASGEKEAAVVVQAEPERAEQGLKEDESGSDEDVEMGFDDEAPDGSLGGAGVVQKRQTLVFSATLTLPPNFKKLLKKGARAKRDGDTVAGLVRRAGMSFQSEIIDLTNDKIVAQNLEEGMIECADTEKDSILYYLLRMHPGRTLVFCTAISAVRRVAAILKILELPVWPLHAQMQQQQRLKAMDRFRAAKNGILVATDVAARGLDIPGVRFVIHYQLPLSTEIYIHRSGRTARASQDGCSVVLVSPSERRRLFALCQALSKTQGLPSFPINQSYIPGVKQRVSLALKIDAIQRKNSQENARNSWMSHAAEAMDIILDEENDGDDDDDDDDVVKMKATTSNKKEDFTLKSMQKALHSMLLNPLEPVAVSRRFVAAGALSPLVAEQLQQQQRQQQHRRRQQKKMMPGNDSVSMSRGTGRAVVLGQEGVEAVAALRGDGTKTPEKKKRRH